MVDRGALSRPKVTTTEVARVFVEARDIRYPTDYYGQVQGVRDLTRRALITGLKKGYGEFSSSCAVESRGLALPLFFHTASQLLTRRSTTIHISPDRAHGRR